MRFRPTILLFFVAVFFIACEQGNIDLDNSGDQDLEVQIDELRYKMPSNSYKNLSLEKGLHTIVVKDENGKVLDESRFTVENGGLLNLGKSNYVIWTELYGSSEMRKEKLKLAYYEIETEDGVQKIWGEFEKLDPGELYVEARWDHGLDEDFKDQLWRLDLIQEKYVIVRKIFREEELLEEYKALQNKK